VDNFLTQSFVSKHGLINNMLSLVGQAKINSVDFVKFMLKSFMFKALDKSFCQHMQYCSKVWGHTHFILVSLLHMLHVLTIVITVHFA